MRKSSVIVSASIFLFLILCVFLSFALLTGRIRQEIPDASPGQVNLSHFDFNKKLAYIPHTSFLYYKNELYTSEDFRLGLIKNEPVSLKNEENRFNPGDYGTYRILLSLPANGMTYGLSSYSAMYSQRLFINGKEYVGFGFPGKSSENTIPKTGHYTVYFTPRENQTEIIIQFSNFNHADYGGIVPLYVGSQDSITERDVISKQRIHFLTGCCITVFLLFMGMFLFFKRRYAFLWFSLACFSVGIRTLIVNEKAVMLLLPDLSWDVSIGLEYFSLILLLCTFLLYIHSMFKGALHKVVLCVFGGICVTYAAAVLLLKPMIYTRFIIWFQLLGVVFGIYVVAALVYNIASKKDNRHKEHILILIGGLVFIVLSVLDIQIHRSGGYSLPLGLTETGMMVLIFTNMIALILQFLNTEIKLDEVRKQEQEMQETNRLMDRMSHMKSDFMADISHEMRTPLTVMASYAGLTAMQLRRNATDEKTLANLDTIKGEAIRLAGMVEKLKEMSMEKERQLTLTEVNTGLLMQQAADFCEQICLKNNNSLIVGELTDEILIHVNRESIFQVLINLIINANRHTREGTIRLNAKIFYSEGNDGFIKLSVTDNGDGIDSQLLPSLFQRGVSGDGGSGLGLAICKEIIEEHGGRIWIESEKGKGTTISFTLPYIAHHKGEIKYE